MIGRAARGNPWIFRRILEDRAREEASGRAPEPDRTAESVRISEQGRAAETGKPDVSELREMVLRHAQMVVDQDGEGLAMRKMRKHVAWYTVGYRHASKLRAMSNSISTMDDLRNLLTLLEP